MHGCREGRGTAYGAPASLVPVQKIHGRSSVFQCSALTFSSSHTSLLKHYREERSLSAVLEEEHCRSSSSPMCQGGLPWAGWHQPPVERWVQEVGMEKRTLLAQLPQCAVREGKARREVWCWHICTGRDKQQGSDRWKYTAWE